MAELAEDPLAPDWEQIDRGDPRAVASALFVIWALLHPPATGGLGSEGENTGEWTPLDMSGAGLVFSLKEGSFIRIGQYVMASAAITFPITADASPVTIGGLPAPVLTTLNSLFGGFPVYTTHGAIFTINIGGGSTANFYSTAGVALTNANFSNQTVVFTFSYRSLGIN